MNSKEGAGLGAQREKPQKQRQAPEVPAENRDEADPREAGVRRVGSEHR